MAANTTRSEEPKEVKAQREVVDAKKVSEDRVRELYQSGANLYKIADEVFGFKSDEAVQRVRDILGVE